MQNIRSSIIPGIVLAVFVLTEQAYAIAFALPPEKPTVLAKSLDHYQSLGVWIRIPKKLKKKAYLTKAQLKLGHLPAEWQSGFGSVISSQHGREFPMGGINEAGLVVESASLGTLPDVSRPVKPTKLRAITELQWVQYVLDSFDSVSAVVKSLDQVTVISVLHNFHYLVCDAKARCAVFEFEEGQPANYAIEAPSFPILTNELHKTTQTAFKEHRGAGIDLKEVPLHELTPKRRMDRLFSGIKSEPDKRGVIPHAFTVLQTVTFGDLSPWQVVYDIPNREVHWQTNRSKQLKHLSMMKLDFSCKEPLQGIDIDLRNGGDAAKEWREYTPAMNRTLIQKSLRFLLNEEDMKDVVAYPDSITCADL